MKATLYTAFFFLAAAIAGAQPGSYTYQRRLNPVAADNYYAVPLAPEITAHCKSNGNDIRLYRITEKDTAEIPYLLCPLGNTVTENAVPFELINDVSHLKCCSFLTLKMDRKRVINSIRLDIKETDFDKHLGIEGSNDNEEWFTIGEHLRITGFQNAGNSFRSTQISFPDAEYGYFRIRFDDDSSDKITVINASASETKTVSGRYDQLPVKNLTQAVIKKEQVSELIITLPEQYVLSYITLKSPSRSDFYRNVNIYRSNGTFHTREKEEELWEQIGSGVVSSAGDNTFDLHNVRAEKIKLRILNYDDQPVPVNDVRIFSEKYALEARLPAKDRLVLVYGKENAAAPVYDLGHFREKIPPFHSLATAGYGSEELLAQQVAAEGSEPLINDKRWLWIVMGVVIFLIGYFALSMLKSEG